MSANKKGDFLLADKKSASVRLPSFYRVDLSDCWE